MSQTISRTAAPPTIARGASVIAGVTVVSRLAGFARTAVLGQALGATFLGNTYTTANSVPNVVYEVLAGGALASLVVPVLARPAATPEGTDEVGRTTSALLTWTLLGLVPLAVAGALLARPVMSLLVGSVPAGQLRTDEVDVGARLLVIFMPQVVLYGIGIICSGVLQAHRRFLAPALAPLVSSVAVTAAYLIFIGLHTGTEVTTVSRTGELVLAVGTTVGVFALTVTVLLPVLGMRLRLRPRLDFPTGVAGRVGRLAAAGAAVLLAQQASVVVALRLANPQQGAVLIFTLATAVFLLPWAVLAVPIASSAFPVLSAAAAEGDRVRYADTVTAACRAVLIGTLLAAGLLIGIATPVARVLLTAAPGATSGSAHLAAAIRALSIGLVGFGLLAVASRALYADARSRAAGVATVTGWLVVLVADVVLTQIWAESPRATLLGVGNTIGMTVAGGLLLAALRVRPGTLLRTACSGALAATVAAIVGLLAARVLPGGGTAAAAAAVVVAGGLALTAGVLVLSTLARDDLRSVLRVLQR